MQHFSINTINNWQRFYRTNFINSLSGFKSAALIASVNASGQPNLAIFSNIVHLGADPALIGFINRPTAATPHTFANISATKVYTINSIQASFTQQAHQTSAKYAENVNEFEAVGLTAMYHSNILAPFVAESATKFALELVEIVPITHNNTFLVIGKITDVLVNETLITPDGFLNLHQAETVTSLGIDGYFTTQKLARYAYAKPDKLAELL